MLLQKAMWHRAAAAVCVLVSGLDVDSFNISLACSFRSFSFFFVIFFAPSLPVKTGSGKILENLEKGEFIWPNQRRSV
ncbi:hypothetical protein BJ912DRAFT_993101 [Pholiota molesta]|nr:hypothetical protein BJ912DRAFT_993101 [Pholiota molesta]